MLDKLTVPQIDYIFPDFSIKQRKIIGLQDELSLVVNKIQGNRIWNSNGKTWDATAANIQVAIDDLPAAGGMVYAPAGTYTFTSSALTAVSNLHLVGCPGSTTFYTAGTDSFWTGSLNGLLEISNKNNVTVEGIKFDADSKGHWIISFGSDNLKIKDCEFTGDGNDGNGQLILYGYSAYGGVANINNTKILNSYFHDIPSAFPIRLYPRTYTVEHTEIAGCRFENCYAPAILIDAYGDIKDTNIHNNSFINLIGGLGAVPQDYAWAIHSGIMTADAVYDTTINNNYYYNSLPYGASQRAGFAAIYHGDNTKIINNTSILTDAASQDSIWYAPGRTTNPNKFVLIDDNYIKNWGVWIDLDCSHKLSVTNNNIVECGVGLLTGYYTQEYIKVSGNTFFNCTNSTFPGLMVLGNSNPLKADIYDNQFIDTRAVPDTTHCVYLTGSYDFSDVAIRRNRFYMPNKAFTGFFGKEGGYSPTEPTNVSENDVQDSGGIKLKSKNSGTSTGTGAQQTIAHGLLRTPSKVILSEHNTGLAVPYQSAAADATNIYVTATNTKTWAWEVEV